VPALAHSAQIAIAAGGGDRNAPWRRLVRACSSALPAPGSGSALRRAPAARCGAWIGPARERPRPAARAICGGRVLLGAAGGLGDRPDGFLNR